MPRQSPELKEQMHARVQSQVTLDVNNLLLEAKRDIPADLQEEMKLLQHELRTAEEDATRIRSLESLSRRWYAMGHYGIAGYYAGEIAELTEDAERWSIAGTTYTLGLMSDRVSDKERSYCAQGAETAFTNALAIDPQQLDHRLNLAISYAEYPPQEQPMKGIMMMLELQRQHPDYVPVLVQLARYGLQTGQTDKAEQRLRAALELDPKHLRASCMLADLLRQTGQVEAAEWTQRCDALQREN